MKCGTFFRGPLLASFLALLLLAPSGIRADELTRDQLWSRAFSLLSRLETSQGLSAEESSALKLECETLRAQLQKAEERLIGSDAELTTSRAEIEEIKVILRNCEESLRNSVAESKRKDRQLVLWKWTAGILGSIALGEGAYILATR